VLEDVHAVGEAGLLGLALHPDFADNHLVYMAYTARRSDGVPVNRLVRFREAGGVLAQPAVLLDDIPAASIHDGARIRFGPDRLLYMTMGDAAEPSVAQDLAALNGKILRLNDDGTTPRDNPFSSPVYSIGHRNPQGIDWDPSTGNLWATEHGQSANDEVNLIERGRNYGWPVIEDGQEGPGMERPALYFTETAAPSGASFYRGTRIPPFTGNLFFGALRGQHVHRIVLDPADRRRVASHEKLLDGLHGRIRDIVTGPDGGLYFCTNNRDGRGAMNAGDDRILRIVPAR
jgi:glucose/arabinose dehydrogenase